MENAKAIELLNKALRCVQTDPMNCGECKKCENYATKEDGIEAINMAIAALEGKDIDVPTKWTHVTEGLPKEKGEYLVTYHPCCWNNVGKEKRVGMDTFKGKTSWAKNKYQRVIAWTKKPEPWKGEAIDSVD